MGTDDAVAALAETAARVGDGPVAVFAPADLRRVLFVFADRFIGDVHVVTGSEMPRGIDVVVAGRLSLVEPCAPAAS